MEPPPYPLPPVGAPVRVAFLGASATAGAHALHAPAGGIVPRFVETRPGTDPRAALAEFAPHVVIALQPVPAEALDELRAAKLAVAPPAGGDEPRPAGGGGRAAAGHAAADTALAAYDRVLRLPGPHGAAGAWRSRPLPVDDRLYADVRRSHRPPRALAVGRSTEHREAFLTPAKHSHDVVHYTHGLVGEALAAALADTDIGIAIGAEPGHGFPPQVPLHLAAGQLLLSQPLTPACGFEPGIDHLEVATTELLQTILLQLRSRPEAYERVRVRGRLKAEEHRASKVWPRIVHDLLQDIRTVGPSIL
ncbi:MAG TPA: hypothetical protein VFG79_18895 [Solirubrobacter sp.]|nr:hypothetical protein [Solirubrobacter sp.]